MERCSARVDFDSWRTAQCSRKAVVERDGKPYCTIHDPEYRKEKQSKAEVKRKVKQCPKCGSAPLAWWRYCPLCGTEYPKD